MVSLRRSPPLFRSPASDVHCHCSESGVRRSLFRVRCQTFTVQSPMSDVHCSGVWCQTFTVQSPVSDVHCSGVLCQTFTVQSPVSDVHCSEVRCQAFTVQESGVRRDGVRTARKVMNTCRKIQ